MNSDVGIVVVSALVATLNPTLIAAAILMLVLPHSKRLMVGYLLGAYTMSIVGGLVIVFLLRGSSAVGASSHLLSPGGQIAIGVLALVASFRFATRRDALGKWRKRRREAKASEKPAGKSWQTRLLEEGSLPVTFVAGILMSFPGITYVNALDHIAHLNPPILPLLSLIVFFCVMQQVVLEGALLTSVFAPDWTQGTMVAFKVWLTRHSREIVMVVLVGIGLLLTGRGVLTIG